LIGNADTKDQAVDYAEYKSSLPKGEATLVISDHGGGYDIWMRVRPRRR